MGVSGDFASGVLVDVHRHRLSAVVRHSEFPFQRHGLSHPRRSRCSRESILALVLLLSLLLLLWVSELGCAAQCDGCGFDVLPRKWRRGRRWWGTCGMFTPTVAGSGCRSSGRRRSRLPMRIWRVIWARSETLPLPR